MPRSSQDTRSASTAGRHKTVRNAILDELRAALDDADLRIILSVFKADVEAQLNDLRDFASSGKDDAARRIAHRLAGLLAQFGATDAAERAHRMAAAASNPGTAKELVALASASRQAVTEICGAADKSPTLVPRKPSGRQPAAKRPATRRRIETTQSA